MRSFGDELARLMTERAMGVRQLARLIPCNPGYITNIRTGNRRPSSQMAERIDHVLKAGGKLMQIADDAARSRTASRGEYRAIQSEEEEDMERRQLLQSLAAMGISASPMARGLEDVRVSLGRAFGHDDRDHLDAWEEIAVEYGYSYITSSPVELIPGLAADLVTVRSIVARMSDRDPEYQGWCRIGGILSGLMAKSLSNLGDVRGARQWWNFAQHVIDTSGDLSLSLWVRGQQLIHGLYENRPPQMLLRQARRASGLARGHDCPGLADVSTGMAQCMVLAGDHESAAAELRHAEGILGRLPSSVTRDSATVMGWGEDRLRYTQAWVYAHMGDEGKTDQAARRALELYPQADTRTPVQIGLMRAFARIQQGDVSEGIRHAQAVYAPLISDQRTAMVDILALRVLTRIPEHEQSRPDVADYRALVASSSRKMIES